MTTRRERRSEAGFALLIVLWSVVLLSVLATAITARGRGGVQLANNLRGAAEAESIADGAVQEAAFHLLDPVAPWRADGQPRMVDVTGAQVMIRIEDQAGKINPNLASRELMQAILLASGAARKQATDLAAALVEWRFPRSGQQPGSLSLLPGAPAATDPNGDAALRRYRNAGLAYGPPGAPFESMDELGLVIGMTPALLASLAPHMSLINDTDPDPVRADTVVRTAIQMATGAIMDSARQTAPPEVVVVTAEVRTPSGSRFVRRAALRLGRSQKEKLLTILEWQQVRDLGD